MAGDEPVIVSELPVILCFEQCPWMDPDHAQWIRRHNEKVQHDRDMERKPWKSEP